MAVASISFRGTTVAAGNDSADTLVGLSMSPGKRVRESVLRSAEIGLGHWRKRGNVAPGVHVVEAQILTSDFRALMVRVEGLADAVAGSLVVSDYGTFSNVVLKDVDFGDPIGAAGGKAAMGISLTFEDAT